MNQRCEAISDAIERSEYAPAADPAIMEACGQRALREAARKFLHDDYDTALVIVEQQETRDAHRIA
jgi:hypothetical protein